MTVAHTVEWDIGREAEKKWRRLNSYVLVIKVMTGTRFVDCEEQRTERKAA